MATIKIDIISAEKKILSNNAKFISLPGETGELGILAGHTPLITRIRPGTVRIEMESGDEEVVFVAGGILEVQPYIVTVLADTAIRGKDLDELKIEEQRLAAEETLCKVHSNLEYASAKAELASAVAKIAAIKQLRRKKIKKQ